MLRLRETKKTKAAILTANLKKIKSRERESVNEVCRNKGFFSIATIHATFYLFIYLFHFIFAFSLLTFFCRLYRRQLLYCCPPRIAPLIVGNIDLTHLTTE